MVFVHVHGYETIDHSVQTHLGICPLFLFVTRPEQKFLPSQLFWDSSPGSHFLNYLVLPSQSHYFEVVVVGGRYSMYVYV